jgi:hypothetical protein
MRTSLRLAALSLDRAEGGALSLAELWHERPIAIAWVRHFG